MIFTSSPVQFGDTPHLSIIDVDGHVAMRIRGVPPHGMHDQTSSTLVLSDELLLQLSIALNAEAARRYKVKPFRVKEKTNG